MDCSKYGDLLILIQSDSRQKKNSWVRELIQKLQCKSRSCYGSKLCRTQVTMKVGLKDNLTWQHFFGQ